MSCRAVPGCSTLRRPTAMEYDPGLRRPDRHSARIVVTFIVRAACRQLMIARLSVRQLRNATAG